MEHGLIIILSRNGVNLEVGFWFYWYFNFSFFFNYSFFQSSHIETSIVYPPCDTTDHQTIPIANPRKRSILSLGQFRPEKDHIKQLYALRKLIDLGNQVIKKSWIDPSFEDMQLVFVGGCRNDEDERRVEELKTIVADLGMEDRVVFEVNVTKK